MYHNYFCPTCGQQIDPNDVRVSVAGYFVGDDSEGIYPFMNSDTGVSDKDLLSVQSFACVKAVADLCAPARVRKTRMAEGEEEEMPQEEVLTLEQLHDAAEKDPLIKEYLDYLPTDRGDISMIRISTPGKVILDLNSPTGSDFRMYVCLKIIDKKLREAMKSNNMLITYLLSFRYSKDQSTPFRIDLRECFSSDNIDELVRRMRPLFPSDTLKAHCATIFELSDMIEPFVKLVLDLEYYRGQGFNVTVENDIPINATFGQRSKEILRRVCPNCGAHLHSQACLFPQKIISFVGMPACGKSTIITGIFDLLSTTDPFFASGSSSYKDPFYTYFKDAKTAMSEKRAIDKTSVGFYPYCALALENEGGKYLYTFVDVPGEHFVDKTSQNGEFGNDRQGYYEINMNRLSVMEHSDVICICIAAEQLVDLKVQGYVEPSSLASTAREDLQSFVIRVQQFYENVLHAQAPSIVFAVTKVDAFPNQDHDFDEIEAADGTVVKVWNRSTGPNTITRAEIGELYESLNDDTALLFNGTRIVDMGTLHRQQSLSRKMLRACSNASLINNVAQAIGLNGWDETPVFFTSPLAFYAVSNVWTMPLAQKKAAYLTWAEENGISLSDEDLDTLAKAAYSSFSVAPTQEAQDQTHSDLLEVQRSLHLSRSDADLILRRAYQNAHKRDRPYGVSQFLAYILAMTGLYNYACSADRDASVLGTNRDHAADLTHYSPDMPSQEGRTQKQIEELWARIEALRKKKSQLEEQQKKKTFLDRLKKDKKKNDPDGPIASVDREIEAALAELRALEGGAADM